MISGTYNILLFEENNADIIILRECFRALNFTHSITVLKSEQSFYEILSSERSFDCIISEFKIPDLTAPEILRKIKKTKLADVPFIILTSEQYPGNLILCSESGADLVINKAADFFEYLENVKNILKVISDSKSAYMKSTKNE